MVISIVTTDNKVIGYAFLDDLVCHTEKGILDIRKSTLREIPDMDKDSSAYQHFANHFREYKYNPETKSVYWEMPDYKREMEASYTDAED